jgi:hypothetical protein
MGFVKQIAQEQSDAGFSYWGREWVCADCIADEALAAWVDGEGNRGSCSICESDDTRTVWVHDLFVQMAACIADEYTTDVTMDGEIPTLSSGELLYELDEPLGDGRLRDMFEEAFLTEWGDRHHWTGSYDERLAFGWEQFVDQIRNRTRFVFLHPSTKRSTYWGPADIEPAEMLDALGDVIKRAGLVIPFPAGQPVYRGRTHHPAVRLATPDELGAPPPAKAGSQRMNPPGIPYFYGATDEATSLAELRSAHGEFATIATWVTRRGCFIVDLVRLDEVPSIFDSEQRHRRLALRFLHKFRTEIAKRLEPGDDPAIDYVPTHIVAEYIRHCLQSDVGGPVEGLMYPSAVRPGGTNIVFFVNDTDHHAADGLLQMYGPPRRYEAVAVDTRWEARPDPGAGAPAIDAT